jgi:hypothetical protein
MKETVKVLVQIALVAALAMALYHFGVPIVGGLALMALALAALAIETAEARGKISAQTKTLLYIMVGGVMSIVIGLAAKGYIPAAITGDPILDAVIMAMITSSTATLLSLGILSLKEKLARKTLSIASGTPWLEP